MKTQVETIEYFDDRFYKLQVLEKAVYYPSVTTILGIVNEPFLARWRGDVGNDVADYRSNKAKQMGSNVHEAIDRLFAGDTLEIDNHDQHEWVQLMRFMAWFKEFKPQDVSSEQNIYSIIHEYAGTRDIKCRLESGTYNIGTTKPVHIEGGLYIGDYKAGKNISKKYAYQLGAYVKAEEEMTGEAITGGFILHLNAQTKSGWKVIMFNRQELEAHFQTFRHATHVWKAENADLTPDVFEMPRTITL